MSFKYYMNICILGEILLVIYIPDMKEYNTTLRSLYRHVVCNVPVTCITNVVGNQLGAWLDNDCVVILSVNYEPRCEKTGFLHMRKQRCRSASR